uniref:Uncharacterized protein n=1 Tax=Vitis vinifera TaxID=29760 RepID=F6HVE7_VITVI
MAPGVKKQKQFVSNSESRNMEERNADTIGDPLTIAAAFSGRVCCLLWRVGMAPSLASFWVQGFEILETLHH